MMNTTRLPHLRSTERDLFFDLLHNARRLKRELKWPWLTRRVYLLGMMRVFVDRSEDFKMADQLRDFHASIGQV